MEDLRPFLTGVGSDEDTQDPRLLLEHVMNAI